MTATRLALVLVVALLGLAMADEKSDDDDDDLPQASQAEASAVLSGIERIPPGTSLLITSANSTVIYATGQIGADRNLRLLHRGPLPAGAEVRILIGLATAGRPVTPHFFEGVVDGTGRKVLVRTGAGWVDLARVLAAFEIKLEIRLDHR